MSLSYFTIFLHPRDQVHGPPLGVCHFMDSAQNAVTLNTLVCWLLSTEFLDVTTGPGRTAVFCLPPDAWHCISPSSVFKSLFSLEKEM